MNLLFSPLFLDALTLLNRIVIPPMDQYSADNGKATAWHMMHYGNLALSGAGLLIFEATAVEPRGRITPQDLGLWSDETEQALREVVTTIRRYSSIPLAIQLGHAGRKGSHLRPWEGGGSLAPQAGGWSTCAPSSLPFDDTCPTPEALTLEGMESVKEAFVQAATRAARLGFDCIELHCAHGYLLHQFLSPLSNTRTDAYGGTLENRMRFILEIFDATRTVFSAGKPVGVRVSATDWVNDGWDVESTVTLGKALRQRGCAYMHVSGGGLSPKQHIQPGPGYQLPYAQRVKAETGLPTIAVGLITQAEQAETILQSQQADLVAIGRAMLYNPRWPWHAAAALKEPFLPPPQYLRATPHHVKDLVSHCYNETPQNPKGFASTTSA